MEGYSLIQIKIDWFLYAESPNSLTKSIKDSIVLRWRLHQVQSYFSVASRSKCANHDLDCRSCAHACAYTASKL